MSRTARGAWRRRLLQATAAGACGAWRVGAAAAPAPWALRVLPAPEPVRRVHAGGPTGLLGVGASGVLWALSSSGLAPRRLASGLDPATRLATGHGRIAARTTSGGLWVWDAGRDSVLDAAQLAVHAGLLVLPLAVLGVVRTAVNGGPGHGHRVARFEPHSAGLWREVARSQDPVLPDARLVQVDLEGRGDGGHIAVLAGPDEQRYAHGVLGDGVEATRLLWLERHGLEVLRALSLPAPFVFEDTAPRAVQLPQSRMASGLLTVRSGPDGGQLALVAVDPAQRHGLRLAALGDTVGGFHRWLAPTTQGTQLLAVHTPHIGGVLHEYRLDSERLARRRLLDDVSTHAIGSREVDLAAWVGDRVVLPSQNGQRLRVLAAAAGWAEQAPIALPGRAVQTAALHDTAGVAAVLEDGRVVVAIAPA